MPQILGLAPIPTAATRSSAAPRAVAPHDLGSDHFSARLVERVGWAVVDADDVEHAPLPPDAGSAPRAPELPRPHPRHRVEDRPRLRMDREPEGRDLGPAAGVAKQHPPRVRAHLDVPERVA